MRVKIVLVYDYEGEETTPEAARAAELKAWSEGNVTHLDIIACDDESTVFSVEVIE
jgi:hypothetical protein